MHKVVFFVPETDKEIVKTAMFNAGSGHIGHYSHCSFESLGAGQFKPLKGSNPTFGETEKLEKVSEWKVEMVCADEHLKSVIAALKLSHPYETPAYEVYKLTQI